jgi:hypothetical protein
MKNTENYYDVAHQMLGATGGYTYLFGGVVNPSTGYVVGNGNLGAMFTSMPEAAYIAHAIASFQAAGYDGAGCWLDEGTWYLDPVTHVNHEVEAQTYATMWGERAYWDCSNKRAVRVQLALEDRVC